MYGSPPGFHRLEEEREEDDGLVKPTRSRLESLVARSPSDGLLATKDSSLTCFIGINSLYHFEPGIVAVRIGRTAHDPVS